MVPLTVMSLSDITSISAASSVPVISISSLATTLIMPSLSSILFAITWPSRFMAFSNMPGRLSASNRTQPPSAWSVPWLSIWVVMGFPCESKTLEATASSIAILIRLLPDISSLTASPVAKAILPKGAIMVPSFSIPPAIRTPNPPSCMVISPLFTRSMFSCSSESFWKR